MTQVVSIKEVRKNQHIVRYVCDNCMGIYTERKSHFDRKTRHFCSQSCYSMYRKWRMPREEQNTYGTGHSAEERAKRRKARSDLNHAIRSGKIKRPTLCVVDGCNQTPEAHHDDYNKALDVRWLCFFHHREQHKLIHENPELLK